MGIGRLLAAVACAMVLTAPSTAAATSMRHHHHSAVMTMEYAVGDLKAVVHAPRTLVGVLPLVFHFRGFDEIAQSLAQRGSVVVLVSDRTALDRHVELWRSLSRGEGPLVERFRGFA